MLKFYIGSSFDQSCREIQIFSQLLAIKPVFMRLDCSSSQNTQTFHRFVELSETDSQIFTQYSLLHLNLLKGKARPLQAVQAQRSSRKLRLLDFLTTAQYGGRLTALRSGRLYPQGYSWYSFSVGAESTPGPWFGRKEICH